MMNSNKYARLLQHAKLSVTTCNYCGMPIAYSNDPFCQFCELYNKQPPEMAESKVSEEINALITKAANLINSNSLEEAEKAIDLLAQKSSNPVTLYVAGIYYAYLSDKFYFATDYTQKGFMEGNAENKEKSLLITSKSKECLYKAVAITDSLPDPKPQMALFAKFLALMALGRMNLAREALKAITDGTLLAYATAAFAAKSNAKNADKQIEQLLNRNINAYYYLASYLAKNGKPDLAKEILDTLSAKGIGIRQAYALQKRIQLNEEEYK